jgi:hypothetical protein
MRFHHLAAGILIAAPLLPLGGQEITTLREGQRVRVSSTSNKELVGVVRQARADSIVVFTEPYGAALAIATSDLRTVEVSRGRSAAQGAKRGALWGGGIGAGLALLGAVIVGTADDVEYAHDDNTIGLFAANMIGGGLMWGAGIGAFVKAERWDRAAIQPRVGLSGVGLSIAFR